MQLRADSASSYRWAAIATLAAAAAGITLLSGLLELRLSALRLVPLLAVNALPDPSWPNTWLAAAQTASQLQNQAINEWLEVAGALLATILLIAAISALVALFAHATARRYEVALSAVVGASRTQLTMLQLRKAALNAGVALVAGVTIGLLGAYIANAAWPDSSAGVRPLGWMLLAFIFCCGLAAFVARGTAARMAQPGWMGDVLAPEARTNPGFGAEDLRGALLHVQFALTFALLAAAMLVWQHAHTTALPAAARTAAQLHVTRITLDPHSTAEQRRALLAQLNSAGAVASPGALIGVGAADQIVSNCGSCSVANMWLPMFAMRTQQHVVGDGFFRTIGFAPHVGREFNVADGAARHVVVNDTFANLAFQGQHPIGKQIQVGGLRGVWYTVIGVIHDVPVTGMLTFTPDDKSVVQSNVPGREPAVYFYAGEKPPATFDLVGQDANTPQLAGVTVVSRTTLAALLRAARAPAAWFGGLLGALAIAAALIATFSLGAITLLNVRQRELEIAARRAVGARRRDIVRMVIGSSAATVARGTFVGVILSVAIARILQMVLPEMRLLDVRVIGATALLLALISLAAAFLPARAAASVMPAQIHS